MDRKLDAILGMTALRLLSGETLPYFSPPVLDSQKIIPYLPSF